MGITVKIDEKLATQILKKYQLPERALKHVQEVKRAALVIAEQIASRGHRVDRDFVAAAALLHDIGRTKITLDMPERLQPLHCTEGAAILTREGYPELAQIAAGHTLPYVNSAEARALGLPGPIVLPDSLEAKIICIADKLRGELGPDDEIAAFWSRFGNSYFGGEQKLRERTLRVIASFLAELKQLGWNGRIK